MPSPREKRLQKEFQRMKDIVSPHSLFRFFCADLSDSEAAEFLKSQISYDVIHQHLPGLLEPDAFEKKYIGLPPEKYLVVYECNGLARDNDGNIGKTAAHAMEIVFGWDYPSKPPTFVWHTPIWHPNFNTPNICIEGHSFAIGLTLDRIVLEVGRMIQYQSYNVNSPLNEEAAEWAKKNSKIFPVDDRDLLDRRKQIGERHPQSTVEAPLVEIQVKMRDPNNLIELVN